MVIVTQNKQLFPIGLVNLNINQNTPTLPIPLIIPDLKEGDVCSLWLSLIIDNKAKIFITFDNTNYNLLQKDSIEKDVLFQTRIIYKFGDRVNFQFDKSLFVKKVLFAFTLDAL